LASGRTTISGMVIFEQHLDTGISGVNIVGHEGLRNATLPSERR
jgi:hypothetical protein